MKKSLIAAAMGLALTSGSASALQIDYTGTGSIAGSDFFDQIAFQLGHTLFDNVFESADVLGNEGTLNTRILMQAHFAFGGSGPGILTYQIVLPATVAFPVTTSVVVTDRLVAGSNVSQFALFYDPTPNQNMDTGLGYGDLNGGALATDQVRIADGLITVDPNTTFFLTDGSSLAGTPPLRYLDEEQDEGAAPGAIGQDALLATISASGGGRLLIDITSQNDLYVVSDLVNADPFSIDVSLESIGFNAPFGDADPADDILSGDRVVFEVPDYGDIQTGLSIRDTFANGGIGVDAGVSARVSDFACAGSGLGNTSPCDMQVQHSGASNATRAAA